MKTERRIHCYKAGARLARSSDTRRGKVRAIFIRDFYNVDELRVCMQGFDDEILKIREAGGTWARFGRRYGNL
jgi:hypothetical protein